MRRVLFICWANCVRSQIAEALLNYRAAGRFEALSGGAKPCGFVHAMALQALGESMVPAKGLRSQSWEDFRGEKLDAVVTLCDFARDKVQAAWPRSDSGGALPVRVHWPFIDPVDEESYQGCVLSNTDRLNAFRLTRDEIRSSIERLALAPAQTLSDDSAFSALMHAIGESLEGTFEEE
jgi:arsenate reductase